MSAHQFLYSWDRYLVALEAQARLAGKRLDSVYISPSDQAAIGEAIGLLADLGIPYDGLAGGLEVNLEIFDPSLSLEPQLSFPVLV